MQSDATLIMCPKAQGGSQLCLLHGDCSSVAASTQGEQAINLADVDLDAQHWDLDPSYYQYVGCTCLGVGVPCGSVGAPAAAVAITCGKRAQIMPTVHTMVATTENKEYQLILLQSVSSP